MNNGEDIILIEYISSGKKVNSKGNNSKTVNNMGNIEKVGDR